MNNGYSFVWGGSAYSDYIEVQYGNIWVREFLDSFEPWGSVLAAYCRCYNEAKRLWEVRG